MISERLGLIFFYIVSQISCSFFFLNIILGSFWVGFFFFESEVLIRGWKIISIQPVFRMRNLHLFPVSKYGFSTSIYSDPERNGTVSAALQEITCFFQDLMMENLESNISWLSEGCLFSKILSYLASQQLSIPNLNNIRPGGKTLSCNESFVSFMRIKFITKQGISCIFFLSKKRKVTKDWGIQIFLQFVWFCISFFRLHFRHCQYYQQSPLWDHSNLEEKGGHSQPGCESFDVFINHRNWSPQRATIRQAQAPTSPWKKSHWVSPSGCYPEQMSNNLGGSTRST